MVLITRDVKKADGITHSGNFHADEIMATVILEKAFGRFVVYRANELPSNLSKMVIAYDIGGGLFDHHDKPECELEVRKNGVPYSSCGLVWRKFGPRVLRYLEESIRKDVWYLMDKELIAGIDAIDNAALPKLNYPARVMSVSGAISMFNPVGGTADDFDREFIEAVKFAEVIFDKVLKSVIRKVKAKSIVEEKIEKCDDGILIIDPFIPWQEAVMSSRNLKAQDIKFVIFPSERGGYNFQCIPVGFGSEERRKDVPKEWWGLSKANL